MINSKIDVAVPVLLGVAEAKRFCVFPDLCAVEFFCSLCACCLDELPPSPSNPPFPSFPPTWSVHPLMRLVCFVGNASMALCRQEFPFYNVPSLNYFLTGGGNDEHSSSSTGLDSSTAALNDLLALSGRRASADGSAGNRPTGTPREFACTICGRKFSLKCNLNRHNLVHTGVRNYGCEVCGQRFVLRQHLKKHLERHAKEC